MRHHKEVVVVFFKSTSYASSGCVRLNINTRLFSHVYGIFYVSKKTNVNEERVIFTRVCCISWF